jgi:hypothetical protein
MNHIHNMDVSQRGQIPLEDIHRGTAQSNNWIGRRDTLLPILLPIGTPCSFMHPRADGSNTSMALIQFS